LFWSGIAAGICISFSVIGEALFKTYRSIFLRTEAHGDLENIWEYAIEAFDFPSVTNTQSACA